MSLVNFNSLCSFEETVRVRYPHDEDGGLHRGAEDTGR